MRHFSVLGIEFTGGMLHFPVESERPARPTAASALTSARSGLVVTPPPLSVGRLRVAPRVRHAYNAAVTARGACWLRVRRGRRDTGRRVRAHSGTMAAEDWGDTKLDVDEGEVVESLRAGELWEDPHFAANDMSLYLVRGLTHTTLPPRLAQSSSAAALHGMALP